MKKYQTGLIAAPRPSDDLYRGDVDTQGIIDTVLYADPKSGYYTKKFAQTLKGRNVFETAQNIWDFLKTQVPYILDKPGYQWIKSPGKLWADKAGDCKSFSVFTGSILKNLGIPYGYRFASYDPNDKNPTHVYIYIPTGKVTAREIIIDAVWTGPFNTEKSYTSKKDYTMAKTSYLGGTQIPDTRRPGVLKLTKDLDQITDGELDLLIARQRLEIEKANAARIGSPFIAGYDESLKVVNHMLRNIDNPDVIIQYGNDMISGIGKAKKPKKGLGKFLKKVGDGIKKSTKAITKVMSAPVRLAAKGMLEIQLPQAAMMFLYLFTPEGVTLPTQMARKKKKAEGLRKFIVKGIGMKDAHFMGIIRNNLTKRFGKSPESFLQEKLKARVSGTGNPKSALIAKYGSIGNIPVAQLRHLSPKRHRTLNTTFGTKLEGSQGNDEIGVISDIIGIVLKAIKWIVGLIKKNKKAGDGEEDPGEFDRSDVPDIEADMVDAVVLTQPTVQTAASSAAAEAANAFAFAEGNTPVKKNRKKKKGFLNTMDDLFKNISPQQSELITAVASDLLAKRKPKDIIKKTLVQSLPFLNANQVARLTSQIDNGGIAYDYDEGLDLGFDIKKDGMQTGEDGAPNLKNGGGARGGFCDC